MGVGGGGGGECLILLRILREGFRWKNKHQFRNVKLRAKSSNSQIIVSRHLIRQAGLKPNILRAYTIADKLD